MKKDIRVSYYVNSNKGKVASFMRGKVMETTVSGLNARRDAFYFCNYVSHSSSAVSCNVAINWRTSVMYALFPTTSVLCYVALWLKNVPKYRGN